MKYSTYTVYIQLAGFCDSLNILVHILFYNSIVYNIPVLIQDGGELIDLKGVHAPE